ncbi:hypothetical protein MASR2M29_04500 [Spirochaetota bacterium]
MSMLRLAVVSVLVSSTAISFVFYKQLFGGALPLVAAIILLIITTDIFLANRLAKKIVEPIGKADLDGVLSAPYDELAPLVKTIETHRKQIAKQLDILRERNDTIHAIMENMSEGIIMLDKKGVVVSANKSVAAFFELPANVNGKNILEVFRKLEFSVLAQGAIDGHRAELGMKQGDKTFRVFFGPIAGVGAIILFMDVTEKSRSEMLRREFSANVSHELKTPLTTIYGNAEMLAGGMVNDEDKASFYDKIKNEAERMIALTEDIILLSSLDEKSRAELSGNVDLAAIAAEAIRALENKALKNCVSVKLVAEETEITANRTQMYELLLNLIDNAIKYNKPGGKVDVCIYRKKGRIRIKVSDTGIGIPKEDQGRVFERFYRVDRSRSKHTGGTGLGLAIVKHIVLAQGGSIGMKSKAGEGTEIKVVF